MNSDLQAIFDSGEFEDNGTCQIESIRASGENLLIVLNVTTGKENDPDQAWEICAKRIRKQKIDTLFSDYVHEEQTHPLLLEFQKKKGTLYFTELECDYDALIGILYRKVNELTGRWIHLEEVLNISAATAPGASGALLRGPVPLLHELKPEIEKLGGKASISGVHASSQWNGERHIPDLEDLKILLFGGSYFIAENFTYEKHNQAGDDNSE